jgi:tetratricopeptide (TPR) repeat protein
MLAADLRREPGRGIAAFCGSRMRLALKALLFVMVALSVWAGPAHATGTGEEKQPPVDPAPCLAAIAAGADDGIVASCGALIDNDKTARADRIKALTARGAAFARQDLPDRAIADYDALLRLDPTLADIFNARGELHWKKGDRPRAVADFAAALKLDPNHPAAKDNQRRLALELERLGAMMAVAGKPSFDCARARRAAEKAICANPDLADLDREIHTVSAKLVRAAAANSTRAARDLERQQEEFVAKRNTSFGKPGYDLGKAMRDRLDHLRSFQPQ